MKRGCLILLTLILFIASGCVQPQVETPMVPSTEGAEQPAETVSPTPVTTLFPHPTDIFILNQDWGTWHDVWVKGEIPKLVSKTRATAIHHLGGQAVRTDPDYERS
ncbi:MAG: hypothetical protein KAV87_24725, partial [Desulfobacteraceae bacterium]|nr:hypothetical protein [Desulfobacteraceae bacterium]